MKKTTNKSMRKTKIMLNRTSLLNRLRLRQRWHQWFRNKSNHNSHNNNSHSNNSHSNNSSSSSSSNNNNNSSSSSSSNNNSPNNNRKKNKSRLKKLTLNQWSKMLLLPKTT